ncbi:MAG: MFS transporter, partial [Prevotellamassilia sp.]|nr:MFS transporter [Prevotellamassilia sp.]
RFGLFGLGNPGPGVWLFVLSMILYGVALDFFNVTGSLLVDQKTTASIRSSAQGLFMIMTNGCGSTLGMIAAQAVVDHFTSPAGLTNWPPVWYIFATYALVVLLLFALVFREKKVKA